MIQTNSAVFNHLVSTTTNDQSKQQFYQQIDDALAYYNDVTNMLHQANQFYTQLGDYLNKLYQNIMDFKMSRELEKNDII